MLIDFTDYRGHKVLINPAQILDVEEGVRYLKNEENIGIKTPVRVITLGVDYCSAVTETLDQIKIRVNEAESGTAEVGGFVI